MNLPTFDYSLTYPDAYYSSSIFQPNDYDDSSIIEKCKGGFSLCQKKIIEPVDHKTLMESDDAPTFSNKVPFEYIPLPSDENTKSTFVGSNYFSQIDDEKIIIFLIIVIVMLFFRNMTLTKEMEIWRMMASLSTAKGNVT